MAHDAAFVPGYSDGSATDLHRLPNFSPAPCNVEPIRRKRKPKNWNFLRFRGAMTIILCSSEKGQMAERGNS